MENKILLIYNPVSGRRSLFARRRRMVQRVASWFEHRGWTVVPRPLPIFSVEQKGDTPPPELPFLTGEYQAVIAAGGDGTLHWVVNDLMNKNSDLPVAILPWGTSNDFAAHLGIYPHHSLENQLQVIHTALSQERYMHTDIGEVDGRYFINSLAFGLMTNVAYEVSPVFKNKFGRLAYYLSAARSLSTYQPFRAEITTPGGTYQEDLLILLIQNTTRSGGFQRIAPLASCTDGRFEIIGVRPVSKPQVLLLLSKIVRGSHLDNPSVLYLQTEDLSLTADRPLVTTVDGERGPQLPLTVHLRSRQLRVLSRK